MSKLTIEFYIENMPEYVKLFWYRVLHKWILENEDHELFDIYEILGTYVGDKKK